MPEIFLYKWADWTVWYTNAQYNPEWDKQHEETARLFISMTELNMLRDLTREKVIPKINELFEIWKKKKDSN